MKNDYKNKKEEVKVLPKKTVLAIHEIEENAFIVNIEGWRMRVYFDKDFKSQNGKEIEVSYFGDLNDPHSVRFEKLK